MQMHVTKKKGKGNAIHFAIKIDGGTSIKIKAANTDDSIASALRSVVAIATATEGRAAAKKIMTGLATHLAALR